MMAQDVKQGEIARLWVLVIVQYVVQEINYFSMTILRVVQKKEVANPK